MDLHTTRFLLPGLSLMILSGLKADEANVDFWDETIRLFTVTNQDETPDENLARRQQTSYWYHSDSDGFDLDHSEKKAGDFSIHFTPRASGAITRFGFNASLWGLSWKLNPDVSLQFWLQTNEAASNESWKMILTDAKGRKAHGSLTGIGETTDWQEVEADLSNLRADSDFDWNSVSRCEFEASFAEGAELRFDSILFRDGDTTIAVTDKTVAQRMAEAEATREERRRIALQSSANHDQAPVVRAFAKMYLNIDLENANRILLEEMAETKEDTWSLLQTPIYCRFYLLFSNRAGKYPGRMWAETEERLLETLWRRTHIKNDIHWARETTTWWMDGSENHDLNAKASSLVSARIFMGEPEYKDRIYPNFGFGGGYHYGRAGYYGQGIAPATRHGGGRANLSDGKKYAAEDQYNEWASFLKEYFKERAKRGFFLENSSNIYSKHTLNMVDLVYQYSGDPELKAIVGDFLTLYWADWAQKAISGLHGGPKTRHHRNVGGYVGDSTEPLIRFHLGGAADGGTWFYWNLINDYKLPEIVWHMALDREAMGTFVYRSRGIGEETDVWPRPLGAERTMITDPDSRFLKYTYVTPDYTLGTQMDHPMAIHSHLSIAGRWHGMTFAQSSATRIVPVRLTDPAGDQYDMELMTRTVQHENTLVLQQARRWNQIDPTWYPAKIDHYDQPIGIYIGTDWDRVEEINGWIFLRKGHAYGAIRPVLWDAAYEEKKRLETVGSQIFFNSPADDPIVKIRNDSYRWNSNRSILVLEDIFACVIIQAGRKQDYPSFEGFIDKTLNNQLELYKTVVPGFNVLVYNATEDPQNEIVFNAANIDMPTIGGEPVDYSYPMTFDSPYLKSEFKSGEVSIEFLEQKLFLDFSNHASDDGNRSGSIQAVERSSEQVEARAAFAKAEAVGWKELFFDDGTGDWTERWFLDGDVAHVETSEKGMQLTAGPQFRNDAHHMVLWTKSSFEGDLKIEFDYTRLDFESRCVNILYIQATGSGKEPYVKDIAEWSELRREPAMRMYFDHMHAYHISYAAFPNIGEDREGYIRGRRYMPNQEGLAGTDLVPDYFPPEELFAPGVPHHFTVIKRERSIYMRIESPDLVYFCHVSNQDLPGVTEGRIGLRHMFTRSARYGNFRVSGAAN